MYPAHQLAGQTFQPQLARYSRIERGKITGLLLDDHVTGSASHNGQILSAQLMRIVSDRDVKRLPRFEIPQRVTAQGLNGLGSKWRLLAELFTQRTEIRPSL